MTREVIIERVTATRCRTKGLDLATEALLDEQLSFFNQGYQFTPAFRRWRSSGGKWGWDGKTHLYHPHSHTFPIGLLDRVASSLQKLEWEVDNQVDSKTYVGKTGSRRNRSLVQPRSGAGRGPRSSEAVAFKGGAFPAVLKASDSLSRTTLPGIDLYDHQVEAGDAILEKRRGIVWAATGAGKTEVAIAVTKHLLEQGVQGRILFLSGRKKLLRDTHKRFVKHLGDDIGFLGDGTSDIEPQVVVASVDTLRRRLKVLEKWRKTIDVLFVDECHHAASASWFKTLMAIPASYRIGLSGTPLDRGDNKNLMVIASLGEIIYEVRAKTLSDKNLLARTNVDIIPCRYPDDIEDTEWDFVPLSGITGNLWRNQRIASEAKKRSKLGPVLILVQEIEHGNTVQKSLAGMQVKARFVHGTTKAAVTDHAVEELNEGSRKVLIASPIFREGVDIPKIRTVIIADGGKSVIKILQQVGRGIRKKAGENRLTVCDFADLTNPYLSDHSLSRIETYKREGWEVSYL